MKLRIKSASGKGLSHRWKENTQVGVSSWKQLTTGYSMRRYKKGQGQVQQRLPEESSRLGPHRELKRKTEIFYHIWTLGTSLSCNPKIHQRHWLQQNGALFPAIKKVSEFLC